MKTIGSYAKEVGTSRAFEDTVRRVSELLTDQGFGILCDIDVQATLNRKLAIDTKPYRILGACIPRLAHRALEAEPNVGVFLPCSIAIWDEGPRRVVAAMEPRVMSELVDNGVVREVAEEVSSRIQKVLEGVGAPKEELGPQPAAGLTSLDGRARRPTRRARASGSNSGRQGPTM